MNATLEASRPTQATAPKKAPISYTLFFPFVIVLLIMIVSAARETASLHRQKATLLTENQQSAEFLIKATQQADALHTLQNDLQQLAATDPVAAKISLEYFPPAPPATQNPSGQ